MNDRPSIPSAPPRRSRANVAMLKKANRNDAPKQPTVGDEAPATPEVTPEPVRGAEEPIEQPTTPAATNLPEVREEPPAPSETLNPAPKAATKSPDDVIIPSSVQIPVDLKAQVAQTRDLRGLSTGEIFLDAIETHYEDLERSLNRKEIGGRLFAARAVKPVTENHHGTLSTQNYRLRRRDYAVLDDLVQKLGASSRSHLITQALTFYFK